MEIFFLATLTCLVIWTIGYLINKYFQIPWMFTVVVFGMILSSFGLFKETMEGMTFQFLAKMGMLFFLFTIGIDLELKEIRKLGKYIVIGEIFLTLTEGLLIAIFLYFLFPEFVSHSFLVALLCGIAFGTVGEVILLAILKEFGLEKTKFGQLALGIGVADNIYEILVLAIIVVLPGLTTGASQNAGQRIFLNILVSLLGIGLATAVLSLNGKHIRSFLEKFPKDSFSIPFLIFMVFFAFIYFGSKGYEMLGVVAAIFSGIVIGDILPENFLQQYKKPIYFVGNVFFGPFFFLSIGGSMSLNALLKYPLIILAIMIISLGSRVLISYLLFRGLLGKRQSLVMGIGLTTKFSTSVVSEKLLFSSGLIAQPLYSTIIATYILLKPIIIGIFSMNLAKIKNHIH